MQHIEVGVQGRGEGGRGGKEKEGKGRAVLALENGGWVDGRRNFLLREGGKEERKDTPSLLHPSLETKGGCANTLVLKGSSGGQEASSTTFWLWVAHHRSPRGFKNSQVVRRSGG